MRVSVWLAMKDQLDLAMCERSDKGEVHALEFQAYFLSQLTAQRCFRLFVCINESPGNAPATTGSKDMFQQQHLALFIHYDGAGANDESRMTKASQEETNAPRRPTKQKCQEIFEHVDRKHDTAMSDKL